jgi:hypothetical protein
MSDDYLVRIPAVVEVEPGGLAWLDGCRLDGPDDRPFHIVGTVPAVRYRSAWTMSGRCSPARPGT